MSKIIRFLLGLGKVPPTVAKFIFLTLLLITPEIHLFAADELTVGVFPRRNPLMTEKMFKPLIKYLEKETGQTLRLETARSFPEFWKLVKTGRLDVVHFNQLHYVLSREVSGYEVFAKNEEFGRAKMAPAIVVRKDSGIRSISDLKNKLIIFGGGKLALIANVGNRLILKEHGLRLSDYRSSFAKNPPSATMAVFYKQADAAGVGDTALEIEIIKSKIDTQELMFLKIGDDQPHIPWAFSKKLSNKIKKKLASALLHMKNSDEGKNALVKAGLTNIVPSTDTEYDESEYLYDQFKKTVN